MNQTLADHLDGARRRAAGGGDLAAELAALAGCSLADLARRAPLELHMPFHAPDALAAQAPQFAQVSFTDCAQRAIYPLRAGADALFVVSDPWDEQLLHWLANRVDCYPALAWAAAPTSRPRWNWRSSA